MNLLKSRILLFFEIGFKITKKTNTYPQILPESLKDICFVLLSFVQSIME